jgi:hypothetical protein
MGRVRLIHDRWLGRDVALKEPVTAADAARLWHEARVTSRLEHPGIVAVYDVGFSDLATPWFAMRVVRGRSLAEHLANAASDAEPGRLLRPVLAACEAMGYAHSRGVIHRDIKPSNLMLGAFGETQVIDWGLARAADLPDLDLPTAGTPAYMSPEQARGETLTPSSDVWSLGAVLFEAITGRPAREGALDAVRTLALAGTLPSIPDAVPAPLAAILRRAMAARPGDRYADGKALAEDLARYLDGRRVDAHRYSPLELLRRFLEVWRVPLAVLATALVVLTALVVIGVRRIGQERDFAQANLALTLVREAQRMLKELRVGEAELLAATALAQTDNDRVRAEARGVLAAIGPERPQMNRLATLPCVPVDVAGDLALCREPGVVRLYDGAGLRFERHVENHYARLFGAGEGVVTTGELIRVFDAQGELETEQPNPCATVYGMRLERTSSDEFVTFMPHCAALVTIQGAAPIDIEPCPERVLLLALARLGPDSLLGACDDGTLVTLSARAGRWSRRIIDAGLGTASRPPVVTAMLGLDEAQALVGFGDGSLERLTLGEGPRPEVNRTPLASQRGLVRAITALGANHALVIAEASEPLVLDLGRGRALFRLPRSEATVAVERGGALILGGSGGGGGYVERWEFDGLMPSFEPIPRGVTTVSVRRDDPSVALGDGPTVVVLDGARRRIAAHTWQESIIRATAFLPSGELVAHGLGRPDFRRFDGPRELPPLEAPGVIARRMAPLADGSLLASAHIQQQFRVRPDRPAERYGSEFLRDLSTSPDGEDVVQLLEDGRIEVGRNFPSRGVLTPLLRAERALAVQLDGASLFALEPDGVRAWHLDEPRVEPGPRYVAGQDADLIALAVTRHRLAAGARDGGVWIWERPEGHLPREVQPRVIVRLHEGRVSALEFGAGLWRETGAVSELLVTGGWDRVARWLDPFPREPEPREVEATWGIALEDIFPTHPEANRE